MSHHAVLARPGNQTPEHHALALLGFGWLWNYGCRVIGFEVPIGSWRFDVVGIRWPKSRRKAGNPPPEIIVVEAKGHRSDFRGEISRKARAERAGPERAAALAVVRSLGMDAPDAYCLTERRRRDMPAEHLAALERYRVADTALRKHTTWGRRPDGTDGDYLQLGKLWCQTVQAETSARYVIAPEGVVLGGELPPGWGRLSPAPAIETKCPVSPSSPERVARLLDHMARAATYRCKDALPGQGGGSTVAMDGYEALVAAGRSGRAA